MASQSHPTISSIGRTQLPNMYPSPLPSLPEYFYTVLDHMGSFLYCTPNLGVGWVGKIPGKHSCFLLVQHLGPGQCHLGVIFTPSKAGNRLSAPRIDVSSMPPTQNVIQDALTGLEGGGA